MVSSFGTIENSAAINVHFTCILANTGMRGKHLIHDAK